MTDQKFPILLNVLAAIAGAGGQYFYKKGGERLTSVPLFQNWPIAVGIFLFCVVMLLFVLAYKNGGRISVVYPFYATTFLWGALIGVLAEKEAFSMSQFAGLALMFAGLALIARGGAAS